MQNHPAAIHKLNELLPEELSAIVRTAMAKAPADRYQAMDELLADLERFENSLAELRDQVRREVEASLARLGELRGGRRRLGSLLLRRRSDRDRAS